MATNISPSLTAPDNNWSFCNDTERNSAGLNYMPSASFGGNTIQHNRTDGYFPANPAYNVPRIDFSEEFSEKIPYLKPKVVYSPISHSLLAYFSSESFCVSELKGCEERQPPDSDSHNTGTITTMLPPIEVYKVTGNTSTGIISIDPNDEEKFDWRRKSAMSDEGGGSQDTGAGNFEVLRDVYLECQTYSTRGNCTEFSVAEFTYIDRTSMEEKTWSGEDYSDLFFMHSVSYWDHKQYKDVAATGAERPSAKIAKFYFPVPATADATVNGKPYKSINGSNLSPTALSVKSDYSIGPLANSHTSGLLTEEKFSTNGNSGWSYILKGSNDFVVFTPSTFSFPHDGETAVGRAKVYPRSTFSDVFANAVSAFDAGKYTQAISILVGAESSTKQPAKTSASAGLFRFSTSEDEKLELELGNDASFGSSSYAVGCSHYCPVVVNNASNVKANGTIIQFKGNITPIKIRLRAKYSPRILITVGHVTKRDLEDTKLSYYYANGKLHYYDTILIDCGGNSKTSTATNPYLGKAMPVRVSEVSCEWKSAKEIDDEDESESTTTPGQSDYTFVVDRFDYTWNADDFGIVASELENINANKLGGAAITHGMAEGLLLADDIRSSVTKDGLKYISSSNAMTTPQSIVFGRYELPLNLARGNYAVKNNTAAISINTVPPSIMKSGSLSTPNSNALYSYITTINSNRITADSGLVYASDGLILHSRYNASIKTVQSSVEGYEVDVGTGAAFDPEKAVKILPYWNSYHFDSDDFQDGTTVIPASTQIDDDQPTENTGFDEEGYVISGNGNVRIYSACSPGDNYDYKLLATKTGNFSVSIPRRAHGENTSIILENVGTSNVSWKLRKKRSDVYGDSDSTWWEAPAEVFEPYYIPHEIKFNESSTIPYNGEYEETTFDIQQQKVQDGQWENIRHQFHEYFIEASYSDMNASAVEKVQFFTEDGICFMTSYGADSGTIEPQSFVVSSKSIRVRVYPKKVSGRAVSASNDKIKISIRATLYKNDASEGKTCSTTYNSVAAYDGVQITGQTDYEKFMGPSDNRSVPYGYGGKYTQNGQNGEAIADLKWTILDPVSHDSRTLTYSTEINGETPITTSPVNYTLQTTAGKYTNLKLKTTITADGPVTAWGGKNRVVVTREFVFGCAPEVEYVSNMENFIMKSMPTYTFDFTTESWYKNGSSRTGGTGPLDFGTERNYGNYGMMDGQHTETFLSRLSATGIKNCKSVVATCYLHGPNPNSNGLPKQKIGTKWEAPASNGNVTIESSWQTSRTPADDGAKYLPYYFSYELDFIRNGENRQVFASILEQDPDFANYIPLDSDLSRPRVFGRKGAAHTISNANDPLPSVCTTQYPNRGPTLIDITYKYSNWMTNGEDELTFPIGNVVGDYTGTVAKTGNAVSIGSKRDVAVSKPLVSMGTSYIATKSKFTADNYGWEVPEKQYAGLGYLFSMVPTESSIDSNYPYYIKRGTLGELFVSASKFVPVAIKADGIDQAGKPFPTKNDWQTTNLSITADKTEDVSAVDSLTYFPKVGSVCVDTDDQIIWVNETKAGVYTVLSGDKWVPLFYGMDDTGRPLSVAKDTVYDFIMDVSGLPVGEHGISVSGIKEVVGEDGRKGTIVTTANFTDGVYVDEFGNDTGLEIHRFNNTKNIKLDYDESQILIGPNEFITSDLLNRKFDMLYHDFRQVVEFSNSYEEPPAKYVGYIGWGQEFYKENDEAGTLIPLRSQYRLWNSGADSSKNHPLSQQQSYKNKDTIISGCNSFTIDETSASDPKFYVTDYTRASLLSDICWNRPYTKQRRYIDDEQHTEHRQIHYDDVYNEIDVPCPRVTSVKIGAGNKIFACAPQMNKILCYGKKSQQFLYDWGGFGGADSNTKFNGPVCISLNDTDEETKQFVYVLDGGNDCVKKFNNSGLWISTTKYQLKPNEHVVWMDTTLKGKIFVLAYWEESNGGQTIHHGRVMVLEENAGQTAEVELRTTHKPTSIFRSNTDEFMYVTTQRDVVKLSGKGEEIGYFGDNDKVWISIDEEFVEKIGGTIRCGYADKRGQIYLAIGPILMVYSDNFKIRSLYHKNANKFLRPKEDMHIGKQEYVQDWVFNTALQRMHDNINIIRRSIFAKVTKIPQNGAYKMRYDDISPEEYTKLQLVDKDNLYIPVNAPMSSMVINEQLKKLYDGICVLLSFAQDETEV